MSELRIRAWAADDRPTFISNDQSGCAPADEGGNTGTYGWAIKNAGGAAVGTVTVNSGGISLHWTGTVWQQVY